MKKDRTICIKVTEEDEKDIKELREKYSINISSFVREALKREHKKFKEKGK